MSTESERFAVLETEVRQIKGCVGDIDKKLDRVLETKADATYVASVDGRVTELRGWLWGLVIAVGLSLIGAMLSLLIAVARG